MIKFTSATILTVLIIGLFSCSSEATGSYESFDCDGGKVWLERINDSTNIVHYTKKGSDIDSLLLPWPVFRFEHGDLNGDSIPEIAVGVIKETPYWHQKHKRIFIYQIYKKRAFVPLWRGSQVASQLVDFKLADNAGPATVHTLELRKDSSLYEAEYYLGAFGLVFKRYITENSSTEHFNKQK